MGSGALARNNSSTSSAIKAGLRKCASLAESSAKMVIPRAKASSHAASSEGSGMPSGPVSPAGVWLAPAKVPITNPASAAPAHQLARRTCPRVSCSRLLMPAPASSAPPNAHRASQRTGARNRLKPGTNRTSSQYRGLKPPSASSNPLAASAALASSARRAAGRCAGAARPAAISTMPVQPTYATYSVNSARVKLGSSARPSASGESENERASRKSRPALRSDSLLNSSVGMSCALASSAAPQ